MARCQNCGHEISFFRYLRPGGIFTCKYCHRIIHKKVGVELGLVFVCIFAAIAVGWPIMYYLKYRIPAFRTWEYVPIVTFINMTIGGSVGVFSGWCFWRFWVKTY